MMENSNSHHFPKNHAPHPNARIANEQTITSPIAQMILIAAKGLDIDLILLFQRIFEVGNGHTPLLDLGRQFVDSFHTAFT